MLNKNYCETDLLVANLVKKSVKCEVRLIREAVTSSKYGSTYSSDEWRDTADQFLFILQAGTITHTFDFWTGVGHRIKGRTPMARFPRFTIRKEEAEAVCGTVGAPLYTAKVTRSSNKAVDNEWLINPPIATIIHSLLFDLDASQYNFNDWCENIGYCSDSIDALEVYRSCMKSSEKFKSLFNSQQIQELQTLLEDY